MSREALAWLEPERGGRFVDCTVGLGGHAEALLDHGPQSSLLGLDRDPEALFLAGERLRRFGSRVELVPADFGDLGAILDERGVAAVDGIFADLGVSSLQLDRAERGFSFKRSGPLDMRMGAGALTAGDVVNGYAEVDLERVLREYGEERDARRIARAIVAARIEAPLETTGELAALVGRVARGRRGGAGRRAERGERIDPATRVFQALRIEVNRELEALRRLMDEAVRRLVPGGRLVLISYHSLEDRIVKHALRAFDRGEVDPVSGRPRAETRLIEVLTRKPVRPSAAEVAANPRARSARLRAARRL